MPLAVAAAVGAGVVAAVVGAAVAGLLHFRAAFKCKSLGRFCELTI